MKTDEPVLGQYYLLERIGQGGMAEVYHARPLTAAAQEVAVKVIRTDLAENDIVTRRFLREVDVLSRLSHPHILPLLAWGEEEGRLYLVMPWIREGTLSHLLHTHGGSLSVEETLPLFGQLCAAVQYAHEQELIHRDIKPQNVLVQQGKHIFLSDFGIVQSPMDTRLTITGGGMGSVSYMAPEQALGRATRRSDLYSLGIVLYQLLTGMVPFSGDSPFQIILQQAHAPLPDPRQFKPNLHVGLIEALQTALAQDPEARFHTVQDFWQAVQPFERPAAQPYVSNVVPLAEHTGRRPLSAERFDPSIWLARPEGIGLEPISRKTREALSKRDTTLLAPTPQKKQTPLHLLARRSLADATHRPRLTTRQRVFLGGAMTAAFLLLGGATALGFSHPDMAIKQPSSASQSAPQPTPTRTTVPSPSPTPPPKAGNGGSGNSHPGNGDGGNDDDQGGKGHGHGGDKGHGGGDDD